MMEQFLFHSVFPKRLSNFRSLRTCSFFLADCKQSEAVSLLNYSEDGSCVVYVDGACLMNGRRGAVGGIGVWWADGHPWNVSCKLRGRRQTNVRAEIQAACEALRIAHHYQIGRIRIYTDSLLVAKGASNWINRWRLSCWTVPLKNLRDWQQLDELLRLSDFYADWCHIPGHSNFYGNEQAHMLASEAANKAKRKDC